MNSYCIFCRLDVIPNEIKLTQKNWLGGKLYTCPRCGGPIRKKSKFESTPPIDGCAKIYAHSRIKK